MLTNTEINHSIRVDELTRAISVPIFLSSTYVQQAPGVYKGIGYSRNENPTR